MNTAFALQHAKEKHTLHHHPFVMVLTFVTLTAVSLFTSTEDELDREHRPEFDSLHFFCHSTCCH